MNREIQKYRKRKTYRGKDRDNEEGREKERKQQGIWK